MRELYLERKMSSIEIAKKFINCSPVLVRNRLREYKIPLRSIQKILPLSNKPKYPQYNFSEELEEKAYLIGLDAVIFMRKQLVRIALQFLLVLARLNQN